MVLNSQKLVLLFFHNSAFFFYETSLVFLGQVLHYATEWETNTQCFPAENTNTQCFSSRGFSSISDIHHK